MSSPFLRPLSSSIARFASAGLCAFSLTVSALAVEAPAVAPATAAPAAKPAAAPTVAKDPTIASPKDGNARFFQLHESFLQRAESGPVGLLFLGDSITEAWTKASEVWNENYAAYQPANFGSAGDRCEHVLWRIEQGELDKIKPKVVVLMIGTNNSAANSAEQIAAGDRKIVAEIRRKLPETKVLLLAIFPRGPRKGPDGAVIDDGITRMKVIDAVNADLAKLDEGQNVRYLNINDKFMENGAIPNEVMPDQLHPSAKGYQIWADAMRPTLEAMLK